MTFICKCIKYIVPLFLSGLLASGAGATETDPVEKWAAFFTPSAISDQEKKEELTWFRRAAESFRGKQILSVAEDIDTHYWERDTLAQAFHEITGIRVNHEIIGEGSVVQRLTEQLTTGHILYDIYVNDSDMIGTHIRSGGIVCLSDYIKTDGKPYTSPFLALDDFINLKSGQDYEGNQLQLPDQHFVNLYWFRHDWFTRPDIKADFKKQYGYELGVPLNWAAYEDIAAFFTGRTIDGKKVYGHLDYGKNSPSLGWRFTDAWLSIAGVGDKGLPNGLPVDEWGIRTKNGIPVGSTVSRGGALNGPAAIYALEKYIKWLHLYAPPEAKNRRWVDAGTRASTGDIAQRIFQYTNWLSDDKFHDPKGFVADKNGKPYWRVAPTPVGKYWDKGMKRGYQDAGSWTIPSNVIGERRHMAWLWAQFCTSRTIGLKKFLHGGTPVRKSTVFAGYLDDKKDLWGGLIEFYRSDLLPYWTDTGPNVPDYMVLSELWWPEIAKAIAGEQNAETTMNNIATAQDEAMAKMSKARFSPALSKPSDDAYWLNLPGSPKPYRPEPKPETIPYEKLIELWSTH
jgi:glycerol transport system substrate-binding protein